MHLFYRKPPLSFQLQYEQLLLKALNQRGIFENSQREMFPGKFPKLGDTPTKIKMTPSIDFFCQEDLL